MNKTKTIAAIDLGSSKVATIIAQIAVDELTFDKSVNVNQKLKHTFCQAYFHHTILTFINNLI